MQNFLVLSEEYVAQVIIKHLSKNLMCGDVIEYVLANNEDSKRLTALTPRFDLNFLMRMTWKTETKTQFKLLY